ncbi:MAG TPA: hypothetical protein VMT90_01750 [Dehalococcoidia bacterium]|jgi:hypothetical protein|nr:hypothetical protein [Dehalococcoidia bacterium]
MRKVIRDPALIACALLFFVGVAIAGVGAVNSVSNDQTTMVVEPTHQVAEAPTRSIDVAREFERALAVLHSNVTPGPTLVGQTCSTDQLTVIPNEGQGAGAWRLIYYKIRNSGPDPCNLPLIAGLKGFDPDGTLLFDSPVKNRPCGVGFCISSYPLVLNPSEPSDSDVNVVLGSLARCDDIECSYVDLDNLRIELSDGQHLDMPPGLAEHMVSGRSYSVWSFD